MLSTIELHMSGGKDLQEVYSILHVTPTCSVDVMHVLFVLLQIPGATHMAHELS